MPYRCARQIEGALFRGFFNELLGTLADRLSRFLREPVVDRTGAPGIFSIKVECALEESAGGPGASDSPGAAMAPDVTSMVTAFQSTLGIRLESHRLPLDVMVIEHAERTPVGN
jgi:uncharacterized protein (TIGR03435 family)